MGYVRFFGLYQFLHVAFGLRVVEISYSPFQFRYLIVLTDEKLLLSARFVFSVVTTEEYDLVTVLLQYICGVEVHCFGSAFTVMKIIYQKNFH